MLGLLVDANSCLHLYVNGMDQGVAAQDIPSPCYPFIDLYGQCEQVSVMHLQVGQRSRKNYKMSKIGNKMLVKKKNKEEEQKNMLTHVCRRGRLQ